MLSRLNYSVRHFILRLNSSERRFSKRILKIENVVITNTAVLATLLRITDAIKLYSISLARTIVYGLDLFVNKNNKPFT